VQALVPASLPPEVSLALEIGAGALGYVALLRAFSRTAFNEILDVLARLIGRRQPA
jgi:hypothetical protein